MGIFWPSRKIVEAAVHGVDLATHDVAFPTAATAMTSTGMSVPVSGMYDAPVSRSLALSLPALKRAVELKVTTLAGLNLVRYDKNGNRVDAGWLDQIEPGRPRFATLCDIGYDLIFNNVAYLWVHDRDAFGRPKRGGCEYVSLNRVSSTKDATGKSTLRIDGVEIPREDIIGFQGISPARDDMGGRGILADGARTIRIGLALEAAARRYADKPRPSERIVNKSGVELDDTEVDELLTAYARGLNGEGVTYSNAGVDIVTVGWDAKQMQIVEARQFNAVQISNLVGINADMIDGASSPGGGDIHYSNVTQDFRKFVQTSLKPFAYPLEGRLSMADVSEFPVRFDFDELLRGNPLERAQVYQILIPLGVLDVDQARRLEDLSGGTK